MPNFAQLYMQTTQIIIIKKQKKLFLIQAFG